MIYYVDGSTSQAGNYIVVTDNLGNVLLFKKINTKNGLTNNETEYMAIIEGLQMAEMGSTIFSDSKICVEQIAGNYKIKEEHLKTYQKKAFDISKNKKIKIIWVERESNLAGYHLEKFIKTNARKRYRKTKVIKKEK